MSHRAITITEPGVVPIPVEVPQPEPGAGQVRIRVEACGVCFADQGVISGGQNGTFPATPGHEVAGRVDAVGAGVDAWSVEDSVALGWFGGGCGICDACRAGDVVQCPQRRTPGPSYPGGWADSVVAPATALARIPDGLDLVDAAPMGCAGVTTFNALRTSTAGPGDVVAVIGLGGLGHLAVQFAAAMGFTVVAVARSTDKESDARELGAAHFVASSQTDVGAALRELGGAALVYSTAADTSVAEQAITGLIRRGELLVSGIGPDPLSLDVGALVLRGLRVRGHVTGGPTDIQDAMRFAVAAGIRPWTEVRPLHDAAGAVEALRAGRLRYRAVLTP